MKQIELSRELFIETIEAMQKQNEHDRKCSDAFSVILPSDFVSGYDNSAIQKQLLKFLQIGMDDLHRDSWIDWFVNEMNFGRDCKEGSASNLYGKPIDLSDAGKLWDFLSNK